MKCPYCGSPRSRISDIRHTHDGKTRRRRECLSCDERYTTHEIYSEVLGQYKNIANSAERVGQALEQMKTPKANISRSLSRLASLGE